MKHSQNEKFDKKFLARFNAKIDRGTGDDACHIWTAGRTDRGYGQIGFGGTIVLAHRVAYEIAHGQPIPPRMMVCHTCSVSSCVNPKHLWLGTLKEKAQHAATKGRLKPENRHLIPRGPFPTIKPSHVLLTPEQVQEIVNATCADRITAARFGISRAHVSKLRCNPSLHAEVPRPENAREIAEKRIGMGNKGNHQGRPRAIAQEQVQPRKTEAGCANWRELWWETRTKGAECKNPSASYQTK